MNEEKLFNYTWKGDDDISIKGATFEHLINFFTTEVPRAQAILGIYELLQMDFKANIDKGVISRDSPVEKPERGLTTDEGEE